MLEYDNSAFYYFALTLLVIYIIPGTWYAVSEFFRAYLGSGDVGTTARSSLEKQKAEELKKQTTGWTRLNNRPYLINLTCLILAWAIFLYLISLVKDHGEVSSFDPFAILGIEQGASLAEIKKHYRRLSLKYHPDKNIGNKFAEEMFLKISKAYEALTDPTAKENYEKFGNPDGKQALEVSIGLPSLLLDNPKVVLVVYLLVMVVAIPSAVALWYNNSKEFGEKNIKYQTYETFFRLMREDSQPADLPEILAASAEFKAANRSKGKGSKGGKGDAEVLERVFEQVVAKGKEGKGEKAMKPLALNDPLIARGAVLLQAHMLRLTDSLTPTLRQSLVAMLQKAPELLDGLIENAQQRKWFDTSIAAIRLSQCIVQGLWSGADPLLQLPFLTEDIAKKIRAANTTATSSSFFPAFLRLPDNEKKGLESLSADQRRELLSVCSLIPQLTVQTRLFVEEDDDEEGDRPEGAVRGDQIFEQDFVTLKVTLTRDQLPSSAKTAAPVFAPFFPATLQENWWIVVSDRTFHKNHSHQKGREQAPIVHAFQKVADQSRQVSQEVQFYAPSTAGKYEIELQLLCDSYLGLDQTIAIPFEVLPASQLPEYVPHPEDLALDSEPTVFEQLMASNQDDSSDEEEEEEEKPQAIAAAPQQKELKGQKKGGEVAPPVSKAGLKKRRTQQRVVEEVEEVEEDD